jgi:DNA polymerase-3 subunit delta
MSKLAGAAAEAFIRQPDPAVRAVLIYGPDAGQVRERVLRLTRSVCPDAEDPFRIADLPPAALKDDPARVADECAALAFGGGRRVVRIADLPDALAGAVLNFLSHPVGDALLIVSAGPLTPRSKIRSAFETAKGAAAIACYPLEGAQLSSALREACRAADLRLEAEALDLLASRLSEDSASLRAEVEKLRLYAGDSPAPLTAEDVRACCGDQSEHSVNELAFAVADGNSAAALSVSDRLFAAGDSPIPILRGVARHFDRLFQARAACDAGSRPEDAMKALKPAVFFKEINAFQRQMRTWQTAALLAAIERLVETERQCKSTGIPAEIVAQRGLMEIASLAKRTRR